MYIMFTATNVTGYCNCVTGMLDLDVVYWAT